MGSKEPIGDKPTPTVSSHEGAAFPSRSATLALPSWPLPCPSRLGGVPVRQWLSDNCLLASFAMTSGTPLIFPSLGRRRSYCFRNPMQPAACPETRYAATLLDPLWLCFALADGLDSRFADNSGRRSCGARVVCGTFPGRDRHPHGLAGHLASTAGATTLITRWGSSLGPTTC